MKRGRGEKAGYQHTEAGQAMVLLILSRVAIGINEIGDGRAAQFNSTQKNLLQRVSQLFHASRTQAIPWRGGMNFRFPQRFIGINVADTA